MISTRNGFRLLDEKTFNYLTESVAAEVSLMRDFGISRRAAHNAVETACNRDEYYGRGYKVWFTDEDAPLGRSTHTIHVAKVVKI